MIGLSRRGRRAVGVPAMLLVLAVLAACAARPASGVPQITVGALPGTAPRIAAEIYTEVLRGAGARVDGDVVVGDERALLGDTASGRVRLFGAFSGALLEQLAPTTTATSADEVYDDLNRALPQGVSVGDATTVSNQPQLVVPAEVASARDVDEVTECSRLPAGTPVVTDRAPDAQTTVALTALGCRLGPVTVVGSVDAVVQRVRSGQAFGLVSPLSSGGTAQGITALADPDATVGDTAGTATTTTSVTEPPGSGDASGEDAPRVRAQNLVPVYATGSLSRDQIKAVNKVAGELTTVDLAGMAETVASRRVPVPAVVADWLAEHEL